MMGVDVQDLDEVPADVLHQWQERCELLRIAAQRVVDMHQAGRIVDPHSLEWAQQVVKNIKPLGRPLTSGEPVCCKCGRAGHLSKDCPLPSSSEKG